MLVQMLIHTMAVPSIFAQTAASAGSDPAAAALSAAFVAACRQDQSAFASSLTAQNAEAFRQLPEAQRTILLKRFVLLENAGSPLLSTTADGRLVVRCQAGGIVSEMRFGPTEAADNLSFIPIEVSQAPEEARSVRFGLVREAGNWKLLSVGLLLLDLPAMARQWEQADLEARESEAVAGLRKIAQALKRYQGAFGRLPEALEQLGPPGVEGISPERARLLDVGLAAGKSEDYRFRYVIVPPAGGTDESERNKMAGFALTATPAEYGKTGRRSFYLDSFGTLRGSDKQGAVATVTDPRIGVPGTPRP